MKQAPWILGGAVLLGTALATLTFVIPFPSLVFLGVGLCFLLIRALPQISKNFLPIGLAIFMAAFWHGQSVKGSFTQLTDKSVEQKIYQVTGTPEEKSFYQSVILKAADCKVGRCAEKKVLWQAPLAEEIEPGQRIQLSCELSLPENFTPDFDYRLYLAKEGVGFICEKPIHFEQLASEKKRWDQLFSIPRQTVEGAISKSIPEPEAGLAKGLLLGGNDHLSTTIQDQFSRLGLTHIVAVSGYNIVLIVNGLLFFGILIGMWRKQATIFAFLGIVFFIIMIGSPASAVRAGIMALAAFGAFLIGRVTYSLLAVWVTAALMVLWNPLYLWYDAGFQLSFLATIAVIVAMRAVEQKLSDVPVKRMFQEIIWLSVWVYLFLLPILILQFKTFTILSIPANILFLPVVPFAMLTTFGVAISVLLFPTLSVLIGWVAYLPLTYILRGTYFLSHLPNMTIPADISLFLVGVWYIFLFFAIVITEDRRKQKEYEKNFHCPHGSHRH